MAHFGTLLLPLAPPQPFVGLAELLPQPLAQGRIGGECSEGLAQIGRQALALIQAEGLGIVVVVVAGARVKLTFDSIETGCQDRCLRELGVGRAVGQAQLETLVVGDTRHMGAIVARVADAAWAPGGARAGGWGSEAAVAVHRGVGDRA